MPDTTLAVLGGSSVATPELIDALLHWAGHVERRPALRVILLGRSTQKLERVRAMCVHMVRDVQPPISIEATTDWRMGLAGVDYILNQMRVGGLEARAYDETFPQALGIPGEETVGPGGFANALRTIPVVLETLRLVAEVAPQALVLNLTNPAAMVQQAVERYTSIPIISLCDGPVTLSTYLSKVLDVPVEELEMGYLGVNHLGWVVSLQRARQDLLTHALESIDHLPNLSIEASYVRATRAVPNPYVRYYLYPERMLAQQQERSPRARRLQQLEEQLMADFEHTIAQSSEQQATRRVRRGAIWYDMIVVPVLDALVHNLATTWIVNVTNGKHIPWLPAQAVVEIPARIDRQGAHPLSVPDHLLPDDLRALLYSQVAYETLAVAAIVEKNRDVALRALVAHPLIRSIERASGVLAAVWPTGGVGHERS